ncbi:RHS repeat-associated core domain-containing protein [Streptomyces sp. BV286]|uniref:RHS repeat-associated core domain-containing protein n=1 Tax=Streptomyces sp. BV286 TaxID=2849672 RepID=UPI001C2E043B|nr:RHS repeat-associated core domain-containing protein [Streptomyces sp. BV286]
MTWDNKAYCYLTELGSVVALADESGTKINNYAYSPRGVTRAATTEKAGVSQPYRFAGGHQDPTGMYHLGARYYDPNIGRFTQPDPSGQEKNPYLYAEGDPVNRIDPNGLFSFADTVGIVAGAAAVGVVGLACAGTAVVAAILGAVATASGVLDGTMLGAAAIFGAASAVAGLLIASFSRRAGR